MHSSEVKKMADFTRNLEYQDGGKLVSRTKAEKP